LKGISQITRRDILDILTTTKIRWAGRLEEHEFLSRLFDLSIIPSTDGRFTNAVGDIRQHRMHNYDWDDDWVFYDSRFKLMSGDDEIFLRFLCETIHPIVRPSVTEAQNICHLYNDYLKNDGFQIVEKMKISGKPVFIGRYVGVAVAPGISDAKNILSGTDPGYLAQQITRMETAVYNDPDLAIGTAKELVETCCKTILAERGVQVPRNIDFLVLVKLTTKELQLTPSDISDAARAAQIIKRLLNNLATITQGIAELRNEYGTGHGKTASTKSLKPRHAKLVVGAAATLVVFLTETHRDRNL
jgi:hypothetical protein